MFLDLFRKKGRASKIIKYLKVIFFILWIFGIFVGGEFMDWLVTILGLYMAITFMQSGREAMEQQKSLHNFFHLKFEVTPSDIFVTQIACLIGGIIMFLTGLGKLLS